MASEMQILREAHDASLFNKEAIDKSARCGCFHCQQVFPTSEIKEDEWIEEHKGKLTAMCPKCGIDSLIGDASGFELTESFLYAMNNYWF